MKITAGIGKYDNNFSITELAPARTRLDSAAWQQRARHSGSERIWFMNLFPVISAGALS